MIVQKSYQENKPTLYLVPTPIGNFKDMTFRSIEALKESDYIFCEDTRITKVLLSHFDISTPLRNYQLYNEKEQAEQILKLLRSGKNISLVSDAGLPCISDPGFYISRCAIQEGFSVISLPGANAALTALVASGLPNEKFTFYGFLASKRTQRLQQLQALKDKSETLIFYEAPHRIHQTLQDMKEILGNRQITLARELTKKYEEYIRSDLDTILEDERELKGEIVIILEGTKISTHLKELQTLSIENHFQYYIDLGLEEKEAMKKVAQDREISKSDVYKVVKKISI